MLNLDTHIPIQALDGGLTAHERRLLQRDPDWRISAIVLWEIEKLFELGRIRRGWDDPLLGAAIARFTIRFHLSAR